MTQIMKADLHTYISDANEDIETVRETLKEMSDKNTSNIYVLMDKSLDPQSMFMLGIEFIPAFWRTMYIELLKGDLIDARNMIVNRPDWDWADILLDRMQELEEIGIDPHKVIEEWKEAEN